MVRTATIVAVLGLALSHLVASSACRSTDLPSQITTQLDTIATHSLEQDGVPALVIAINQQGRTIFERAYGTTDTAARVPSDSIFRIGSVTKEFTAAAILKLAEQQRLSLDDTLDRWIPELPEYRRSITVSQLLNHTAGIPDYTQSGPT